MKYRFSIINVYIILFTIAVSISCKNQSSVKKNQVIDTIVQDIPKDSKGNYSWYYPEKVKLEKALGISSLEGGFDSLQIRLYYGVALMNKLQLVILKRNSLNWNAQVLDIAYKYSGKRDSVTYSIENISEKRPKSGWKFFTDSLFSLNITSLPSGETMTTYSGCNDGDGATVEVATKSKYRIYNYDCIGSNKLDKAKNMDAILHLLQKELEFKLIEIE